MRVTSQVQRGLLLGFILSVVACGLVGIYVLAFGSLGPFEGRVLLTTALTGGCSILALASAIPWETRRWRPVGMGGLACVGAAFVITLLAIWDWPLFRGPGEFHLRLMFTSWTAAIALPHIGLLGLARLHRAYEWVRWLTILAIVVLAALVINLALEFIEFDDEWLRVIGVIAIIDACGTLAVPILHRISRIPAFDAPGTVEPRLSILCPRCGKSQEMPLGSSRCAQCGLGFEIRIVEEQCAKCGYSLYGLKSPVCPECGTSAAAAG